MFLIVLVNIGPAIIMAGIAIIIPYNSVLPISALNIVDIAVGAGWGGKNPWVTDKEASIGNPT